MFMASLGGTGQGLFTPKTNEWVVPIEAQHGLWDVIHPSEDELVLREKTFETHGNIVGKKTMVPPNDAPPAYLEAVQQLPVRFYFPSDTGIELPPDLKASHAFPGTAIPAFDPSAVLPKSYRRPWHDTFHPPHGPPVFFPVSFGYGAEVGLDHGLQALWDPVSKTCFFLDHIRKVTFYKDPRPALPPPPIVPMQTFQYGDSKFNPNAPHACSDPSIIQLTTNRAHSKPKGCTINAGGVNGHHGADGLMGSSGIDGCSGPSGGIGSNGGRGGDGGHGEHGSPGAQGIDGTSSSDVVLNIFGDADELHVAGTCSLKANLGGTRAEEVLFVNCRGGDGGHGGRGGDGGSGGAGGCGGNGGKGLPGQPYEYGRGGDGGPGGNGGAGGNGGIGGSGARGGDAGNAGTGGKCILQAADPCLLILVEANCMNGAPGRRGGGSRGGSGGHGGPGGSGGSGGSGGRGGSHRNRNGIVIHYSGGSRGPHGRDGISGYSGPRGSDGQGGVDGHPAANGSILWVVSSPEGGMLVQSGTRYDAEVTSLHIVSAIDDGVFEPNQRLMVSAVTLVNSGGLPLPSGPIAFFPSTRTVKFEQTRYELPEIAPREVFTIPITYCGRIFDQPPPNDPGPFVSSAEFDPRIELLGRPFEKALLHQKLVVQYPVKLAYLKCNENVGRGEVSTLDIGIHNISSMPYGSCEGSGGKVHLQIHLDSRLIPVGAANVGLSAIPYTVTYDPNIRDSLYVQMTIIPPGETVKVRIYFQMESRAELFDRCFWQTDLFLRDKMIEYNFEKTRVSPFYNPHDPGADVLMVTDSGITRKEFVFWQRILETLNVTVDFWDTDRYNGFSVDQQTNTRHQVSWWGRYTGKMILYPHADLNLLWGVDIVQHFHGDKHRDQPLEDLDSSLLLFMRTTQAHGRRASLLQDRGDVAVLRHVSSVDTAAVDISDEEYKGIHLFDPSSKGSLPFLKWEMKRLKKMEKEVPAQAVTVLSRQTQIQSAGLFKYTYGSVDIRRIPLLRSCKFLSVDGSGGTKCDMSLDDTHLSPGSVEVPLASNFGQVYLATLFSLPMECKLNLLRTQPEQAAPTPASFSLPNGFMLTRADLVMVCATSEIADEVYNCAVTLQRISKLSDDIQANTAAYTANGGSILRGLKLLERELTLRKKRLSSPNISRAIRDIKRLAELVVRTLREAGVDARSLPPLPSMSILMDSSRMHFSHRHQVKDGRWNLVDAVT